VTVGSGPSDVIATNSKRQPIDFNGDGNPDFATVISGTGGISVALGDGTGNFPSVSSFAAGVISPPIGLSSSELAVNDYNLDCFLDIAATNPGGDTVQVLPGNGNGSFNAPASFGVGDQPSGLTSGTFNNDTKPDLATSNFGTPDNISVLLNSSLGTGCGTTTTTNSTNSTNNVNNNINNRQYRRNRLRQYRQNNSFRQYSGNNNQYQNPNGNANSQQYQGTNGNGNSGVSASSGGASTPGAVAQSGNPDQQYPMTGPQGDVVNDVPTSGPLPNTGGLSYLALVLPVGGFLLLALTIIYRVRESLKENR
jgi:hypothetical protein